MSKQDNLTEFLTDVADAIREKKGSSEKINPQNFSEEIRSIESGGSSTPDMPIIGDGKTYLYIKIAALGRMTVPLYFSQTVANGVTIDWGDGSATQTLSDTGNVNTTHTYAEIGEYCISLNPTSGCALGLGHNSSSFCVMGSTGNNYLVYCNMLQAVEVGRNVTSIRGYSFSYCFSLSSITIPESVTSIGERAFQHCYRLKDITIPEGVTSIGDYAFNYCRTLTAINIPEGVTSIGSYIFYYCTSLTTITLPASVSIIGGYAFSYCRSLTTITLPKSMTSIGNYAFSYCSGMAFCDFSQFTSVPTLSNISAFTNIPSDCKIVVPDALYEEWIAATNWSTYADRIIKASEYQPNNE